MIIARGYSTKVSHVTMRAKTELRIISIYHYKLIFEMNNRDCFLNLSNFIYTLL